MVKSYQEMLLAAPSASTLISSALPADADKEPRRLTFIMCRKCYVCQAEDVPVWERYYYHKAFGLEGWVYCETCKPAMEKTVIPQIYEQRGDLPLSCYNNVKADPFFFDRVSKGNPEKNGITSCMFQQDSGAYLHLRGDQINASVEWEEEDAEEGKIFNKCVPLHTIISVSRIRWPTLQSFLDEFSIVRYNPFLTAKHYDAWYEMLRLCFLAAS